MAIPRAPQNHVLGRGEVHFALFKPGTYTPDGYRYFGNTPEFAATIESETLDHYSSDRGIREKDESVPLETNRTGTLVTDHISPENVALFFFGSAEAIAQAATPGQAYTIVGAKAGMSYPIGVDDNHPMGIGGIAATGFTATPDGGAALVENTDFELDRDGGIITFSSALAALDGTKDVDLAYDLRAMTRQLIISGSTPVEGSILFKSFNPKGKQMNFLMPYVKLSPNGDYNLKGDEWQQIPLSVEILKLAGREAIYANGQPAYV